MKKWDYWASLEYAKEEAAAAAAAESMEKGKAEGHGEVLDLMAKGYDYEQIKEILKSGKF